MNPALCQWHKREEPIQDGQTPGCCNCGRLYDTKDCPGCGKEFLDWEWEGVDDVIAAPYATSSGDVYCRGCGPRIDREAEAAEEDARWEGACE